MKTMEEWENEELDPQDSQSERPLAYKRDQFGLYRVIREGGGHVPATLVGGYTNRRLVEAAIAEYQAFLARPKREYRRSKHGKRTN